MSKSTISTFQLFEMFPDAEAARVYMEALIEDKCKRSLAKADAILALLSPEGDGSEGRGDAPSQGQERLTPDDILGDAAPLWRATMKNLHAYAQATKCPLGYDVIRWFGEEVSRLQAAMCPEASVDGSSPKTTDKGGE